MAAMPQTHHSLFEADSAAAELGFSLRHFRRLSDDAGVKPSQINGKFFWTADDLALIKEVLAGAAAPPSVERIPCPFYKEPIGREACQSACSLIAKNLETCCARSCPSPWRFCIHCLRQGYRQQDAVVVNPIKGTCAFHRDYGLKSDRAYPEKLVKLEISDCDLVAPDIPPDGIAVPVSEVRPFANQPRKYFDAGEMLALEKSILRRGQLVPAIVMVIADKKHKYELIDGQRRWHACGKLGIPLKITIGNPKGLEDQYEMSLIANFQRSEHQPMEIAEAIDRMCKKGGRSESDVAELIGRSAAYVNQHRRLVKLAPEVVQLLDPELPEKKRMAKSLAFDLAFLSHEDQRKHLSEIQRKRLSTMQAQQQVRSALDRSTAFAGDAEAERRQPRKQSGSIMTFARFVHLKAEYFAERMTTSDRERMMIHRPADEISRMVKELQAAIKAVQTLYAKVHGG